MKGEKWGDEKRKRLGGGWMDHDDDDEDGKSCCWFTRVPILLSLYICAPFGFFSGKGCYSNMYLFPSVLVFWKYVFP